MKIRSLIVIASLTAIPMICTGIVYQCWCYVPNQIDCGCGTYPMTANRMECDCTPHWTHPTTLGDGIKHCTWNEGESTTAKRPWARAVNSATFYADYNQTNYVCWYPCPHSTHPGLCSHNFSWLQGFYICDDTKAVLVGPICAPLGECP